MYPDSPLFSPFLTEADILNPLSTISCCPEMLFIWSSSPTLPRYSIGSQCEDVFQFILIASLLIHIADWSLTAVEPTFYIALSFALSSYVHFYHPP